MSSIRVVVKNVPFQDMPDGCAVLEGRVTVFVRDADLKKVCKDVYLNFPYIVHKSEQVPELGSGRLGFFNAKITVFS